MTDPAIDPVPTPVSSDLDDASRSAAVRWTVFGVLVAVLIGALGWSLYLVLDRGAGDNPFKKADSLISDPDRSAIDEREDVMAAARAFVQRFNTYGPELLTEGNKMPDYAAVADLMSAKFAKVFTGNVGYAEETVAQTQIARVGTVQGIGVFALDDDSAEVLAAGIVEFSYPDPKNASERIEFAPSRFRYQVSMVRIDGKWKIDDLDDLDDDFPSFAEAGDTQSGLPLPAPSGGAGGADGADGADGGDQQ